MLARHRPCCWPLCSDRLCRTVQARSRRCFRLFRRMSCWSLTHIKDSSCGLAHSVTTTPRKLLSPAVPRLSLEPIPPSLALKAFFDTVQPAAKRINAMPIVYDGYCEQWASRMPDSIRRQASATVPPCARTISASRSLPIISSGLCFLTIPFLLPGHF